MRNGKLRGLLITVMLLVFLAGLASILYPYIWGAAVDSSIASTAKDFLEREEPELPATTVIIDSIKPEKVKPYPELWEDMVRYNQNIAAQKQHRNPTMLLPTGTAILCLIPNSSESGNTLKHAPSRNALMCDMKMGKRKFTP